MNWRRGAVLALLVPLLPDSAAAQEAELTGRVWSVDGTPIEGASVRLYAAGDSLRIPAADSAEVVGQSAVLRAAGTDRLGFFSLGSVGAGEYILAVSRLGFAEQQQRVGVAAGERREVQVNLASQAIEIGGVTVEAERSRARARFEEAAGQTVQELEGAALKAIPGLAEADPLRAIEVLPGVTTVSDFAAAFNVRGGSADQNLILLDDVPIFNPFHLAGFFSVFNADMVDRAELRSGGFLPEYGGRVSSVLLIESDPGDGRFGVDAGVSLLASRVAVNGALPDRVNDKLGLANTRWRISGRRSYFDVLFRPWVTVPYHLSDLQGVFEAWTRGDNRLRVSAYAGEDALDLTRLEDEDLLQFQWNWGNAAAGVSWTSPMSGGGSLDVKASVSRFNADLGFADFDSFRFDTSVDQASLRADLERRPTPRLRWKSGLSTARRGFDNAVRAGGTDFLDERGQGRESAGYTQFVWEASSRWLVEAGVRVDHWRPEDGAAEDGEAKTSGGAETTVSPRFAVKHFVRDRQSAVRVAGGRYTQFLHSRRNEELPFGLDLWVLAGARAPRVESDQLQVAVESFLGEDEDWFASAEGYYRAFDGVIAENTAEDPNDALDDLLAGTGSAWGVDLFVRRDRGRTTGWLSGSFLRATRTFPDARSGLDPAPLISFPPVFDRRFDLDLVLRRSLDWWALEGSLRFNYGTGLPYTRPLGAFGLFRRRPLFEGLEPVGETAVLLGSRNGARYPARHRLDIGLRKPIVREWGRMVPYLNVINVYNQKNVLFYLFDYRSEPPSRSGFSMIPILPTVGLEVSFR